MFGIGLFEFLLIALAILLFVKPKDLPAFFRRAGNVYREARDMYTKLMRYMEHVSREVEDLEEKTALPTEKFLGQSKKTAKKPKLSKKSAASKKQISAKKSEKKKAKPSRKA